MTSYHILQHAQPLSPPHAHIIADDAEALAIAKALSAQFKTGSIARDAERILPFAEIDAFSQSGLWAITVPKNYGGAEVSTSTLAQVIALLSAVDGSIGQIPQNHFYALEILRNTGTEAQQQHLFKEVLHGARFGNAIAEFKTKNSNIKHTQIQPTKDGFIISGEKFYCTGSLFAHRIPTLVIDDIGREYLAFVKRDADGLKLIDDWSGFGQRVTGSGRVQFQQVFVAHEDVIPFDVAFQQPTLAGPIAQIMHAAIDVGLARGAFEEMLQRIRDTLPQLDAKIESSHQDPLLSYEVGRIAIDVRASERLLKQAAETIDATRQQTDVEQVAKASIDVAKVRAHSSETALKAASKLIELVGIRGSQRQEGLDRYWRNVRMHTLHDATRWKYVFIGDSVLNGILPPRRSTL